MKTQNPYPNYLLAPFFAIPIILGILFFLFSPLSCGGEFALSPPTADLPLNLNLSEGSGEVDSQTLIFQDTSDLGADHPVHFNVPLPKGAMQARLYLYGQKLSTLFYSELASHNHSATSVQASNSLGYHHHRVWLNQYANDPLSGTAAIVGTGLCPPNGYFNNSICNGMTFIEPTNLSHSHNITGNTRSAGVLAYDDQDENIPVSDSQKTYCDHLEVLLDGEMITDQFNLNPLGDGTKDHVFNSQGAVADLSGQLNTPGHHRFTFQIPNGDSLLSQGGRLQYVLWVRIPKGPWESLDAP